MAKLTIKEVETNMCSRGGFRINKTVFLPIYTNGGFLAATCEKRNEVLLYTVGQGGTNYKARFSYEAFTDEFMPPIKK